MSNINAKMLGVVAALVSAGIAQAADLPGRYAPPVPVMPVPVSAPQYGNFSFGPTIGTLGIGLEAAYRITPMFAARGSITGMNYNFTGKSSDVDYAVKSKWISGGATLDVHPFENAFRISAGARFGRPSLKGVASGSLTINGNVYSTTLNSNVALPSPVMPYLGIGVDGSPFGNNFTLGLDVGALYLGKATATITSTNPLVPAADLATEEASLNKNLKKMQVYPVVQVSAKYRF